MNVFITRRIAEAGFRLLTEAGCTITEHKEPHELTQEELIFFCKQNDALLSAGNNKIDTHFLQSCSHLKVISLMSVGYDNVDIKEATRLGIPVGNTPDVLSKATSDVALLLMLSVSRKAFYMNQSILNGNWNWYEPTANLGIELYGKTLGIFGLGKIGFQLAKKCKAAFDMRIIYNNHHHNEEADRELNATYVSLDDLLAQSDVLSVHANLSEETKGLFNKEVFEKMKPTSIYINTSRGALHNETDLLEALQNKMIWGAGLDVTNPEPMAKDNPLLTMPTVCVLPHIGSATAETRDEMAMLAARNVIAGLKNEPLITIVNKEVYQ